MARIKRDGMTFNIARFSAHINKYGTVQTNKFKVRIVSPAIFGATAISKIYEHRANSVSIPGVNLDTQNVSRYGVGPQQKFPTNVIFNDIDITFLDTEKNNLWRHFADWMNRIFDYTGTIPARTGGSAPSYKVEYKKYYETRIEIFVYDNSENISNVVILKEAFPTSLSDVSLSWSENNKLYEFTVKFAFSEWYYDGYIGSVFNSNVAVSSLTGLTTTAPIPPATGAPPNPPR